jgi:hypothetical protein
MKYHITFLILVLAALNAHAQMNVRVRGNGIDIGNVGGSGRKLIYPLPVRTEWEEDYYRSGFHFFNSRPDLIRNKDYATTPIAVDYYNDDDNRRDYALQSFSADQAGRIMIAVPTDELSAEGWSRIDGVFSSNVCNFYLYEYNYTQAGTWVEIPAPNASRPTLLFADRGRLKFDNPLPISDLAEGVIIYESTDAYNRGGYIYDPHILVLPNGDYIAGRLSNRYISRDKGKTWSKLNENSFGLRHSSTFYYDGNLYIVGDIGSTNGYGGISRSTDGGRRWSSPVRWNFIFRNSPSHARISRGRVWIAYEHLNSKIVNFASASLTSNLMDGDNWVTTRRQDNNGTGNETDMVLGRDGYPIAIPKGGRKVRALSATEAIAERGEDDFSGMKTTGSKYTAVYDSVGDKYWSLTSYSPIRGNIRTGIALWSSSDLKEFKLQRQVFVGKSQGFHGFNYPSMEIDGSDIVFVLRTAWENDRGQAQRWHDANMFTFHRVRNFRSDVSPTGTRPENSALSLQLISPLRIAYRLPQSGPVKVEVFTGTGKLIEALNHERQEEGVYAVTLDAAKYRPGMYICRLTAGKESTSMKFTVTR